MTRHRHKSFVVGLAIAATLIGLAASDCAHAADLKGKFLLAGDAPPPQPEAIDDLKAVQDFPGERITREDLLVDSKTRGIANVLVYVRTPDVPITDEALGALLTQHVVEVDRGQFHPHVSGLWLGKQTLRFKNRSGAVVSPVFSLSGACGLLPPQTDHEIPLGDAPRLVPQELACNIHPWMNAYLVVRPNPYFAVSAADGSFKLEHLPANLPLEFQVWHEKAGYLNADPKWTKGRFTVTLDADRDLGTIQVAPQLFKPKPPSDAK